MRLATVGVLVLLASSPVVAASPGAQRGLMIARSRCGHCHAIDKVRESPVRSAPPLRTLHQRYPVEELEESLAEGLVTGHPDMPELRLRPHQIRDFIEFLKSLQ